MSERTASATPTPWSYHQDKYDDWGWIHGPDGSLAAVARSSGEYDADEHRRNGTDPYEANARLIVEAVNSHASLKARIQVLESALRGWQAFAEEELSEFDVEGEACSGEALCPKCRSSGCIKLKIDETRAALNPEKAND